MRRALLASVAMILGLWLTLPALGAPGDPAAQGADPSSVEPAKPAPQPESLPVVPSAQPVSPPASQPASQPVKSDGGAVQAPASAATAAGVPPSASAPAQAQGQTSAQGAAGAAPKEGEPAVSSPLDSFMPGKGDKSDSDSSAGIPDLSFSSDDTGPVKRTFVEKVTDYVENHVIPIIVFILIWLFLQVIKRLHIKTIIERRIRGPLISAYLFLVVFVAASIFQVYSKGFGKVFLLTSLTALTLCAVQTTAIIIVDMILARRQVQVPAIIRDLIVIVVFVISLFVVLGNQGVNLTAILASAGFVGIVLGLAMQDTMGNIISGLAIQMEKPFDVGDFIRFENQEGRVAEINWRSVKIETVDRETVIVPNTMITKASLVNLCRPTVLLRLHTLIGLRYETPPNKIKRAIYDAVLRVPGVVVDPPPTVQLVRFADFYIEYKVTWFVHDIARRFNICLTSENKQNDVHATTKKQPK